MEGRKRRWEGRKDYMKDGRKDHMKEGRRKRREGRHGGRKRRQEGRKRRQDGRGRRGRTGEAGAAPVNHRLVGGAKGFGSQAVAGGTRVGSLDFCRDISLQSMQSAETFQYEVFSQ